MRCEAVLRGGAEAEPPKALSQLSCVEAGVGQGGVALLQEGGKAPSDCCIVLRGLACSADWIPRPPK